MLKQRDVYYIEFKRGFKKSLHTKNEREAKSLYSMFKKQYLQGEIEQLEKISCPQLSDYVKIYKSHPDRKNLSKQTHRADNNAIQRLIDIVGDIPLNRITKGKLDSLKLACDSRGMSPNSTNSYLRHIRAALNFAVENGYLTDAPKVKMLKVNNKVTRVIHGDDIDKVIAQAKNDDPEIYRIIIFALNTGCRREEIVKARYEHIYDGMITIYGKGGKERMVPLVPVALEVLSEETTGWIFKYRHVSTLSNYFRIISRAAGVTARFHDLRHTAATQMLRNKMDMETIQKVLGHADMKTTQIYAQVLELTLKEEMKKLEY